MQQQGHLRNSAVGSGGGNYSRQFLDAIWSLPVKSVGGRSRSYALFFSILLLLVGAFFSTHLFLQPNNALIDGGTVEKEVVTAKSAQIIRKPKFEYTFNCSALSHTGTCPTSSQTLETQDNVPDRLAAPTCPEYFRWIHEDLRPWARTGITREALERASRTANFRLAVIGGRIYLEKFHDAFQTRDVFTIWGILQLLRKYPGRVPDLELMFDCVDWPVVRAAKYGGGAKSPAPPPLFRYCGDDDTLDIVFPDWSFWGWAEVNIKPWENLLHDLKEGNQRTQWVERQPYAFWKGNPVVAETRQDLMKCNVSDKHDWNARLYAQDWMRESQDGYKQSDLASQCIHRYKIYIEGSAWSVSEKYILACDSLTLLVKPHYYDFFTRSLNPLQHYWPIKDSDKCRSIQFAVDWGNAHKQKAQRIGKAASDFVQEELKMDYVYDYMLHLLTAYSKLLRFKPEVPRTAVEICPETMACSREGNEKKFMMESLVMRPSESEPCAMPPPYDPPTLHSVLRRRESLTQKVKRWEKKFWDSKKQDQRT